MSVRSRIDKFEALSLEQTNNDNSNNKNNNDSSKRGKRFQFPGKNTLNSEDLSSAGTNFIPINRSPKRHGLQDFESDLQEVWSVRKNIHHAGGPKKVVSSSNSSSVLLSNSTPAQGTAGQYSRHRAIPAQPSRGPQMLPATKDHFNRGSTTTHTSSMEHGAGESRRIPLQDYNSKESAWNVKKGSYSYNLQGSGDGTAKRSMDSPKALEPSLVPAAKRRINRGGMDVIRPSADNAPATSFLIRESQNEKVGYAKKMAQGYLRSMGMGEYTPSSNMYSKHEVKPSNSDSSAASSTARWKKMEEDQEFEFDI